MSNIQSKNTGSEAPHNWGEMPSLTQKIEHRLEHAERRQQLRSRRPSPDGVELRCNDYLSLSGHPAITEAQIAVLRGGGDDIYMSAAFLSDSTMQRAVERKIAAFLGTEDSVLCQSGWCANVGLMQAITDQDTQVYMDHFVHAGMWDGARSTGASIHPFRHNDPGHLEEMVQKHGAGVVVVSALYAGDGMLCPLAKITDIATRHGCELAVDESHTIGVYGRQGEGLVSALGLADKVNYRTFSLSKAMVTRAGMVTGPARVMDFFRYEARPAIFSSAVLLYEVAGLAAALNVIQEEDWRRERLRSITRSLRGQLAEAGFDVSPDGSQIIPLHAGTEADAVQLRAALEDHNLFSTIINAPDGAGDGCFVRLLANSSLVEEDIRRIVEVCIHVRDELPAAKNRQSA